MTGNDPANLPHFRSGDKLRAEHLETLRNQLQAISQMNKSTGQHTVMVHGRQYTVTDNPPGGTAVSACNTVRFQISVADPLTRTALCTVAATLNGCTPADLPDTIFIANGYFIEVCDPGGCFFNEPDSALVGREGWASYMLPIQGSNNCAISPYYLAPEWEVFSLCCAIDSCLL